MKTILIITMSAVLSSFALTSCNTAQDVAEDAEHVVKKAGHVAGHGLRKTGHVVQRTGEKIEGRTENR